jgi:cob(I)alamin adenosyltransferase
LGALDELNSYLGMAKIISKEVGWDIDGMTFGEIVFWVQNCLFIVQAEVAGAQKKIEKNKIKQLETWIALIEKQLPPIKTFFISGGTQLAVLFDISRTMARKAERRVVSASETDEIKVSKETLAFLNRLSTLFYAMARLSNHKSGIKEEIPFY